MFCEKPEYIEDLRFALDVMDENSHLGLDSQHAAKLRDLIVEQIRMAERSKDRFMVLVD